MEQARLKENHALEIRRRFPVAPDKVWRAWTDPKALARWFGPEQNDKVSLAEVDLKVGGGYHIIFGGPQGTEHEVQGVYREVVPNRKLVFTWSWPRTSPERESLVTIVFKAADGGTELEFRHEKHRDEAVRDGHLSGWTMSFAKLEALVGTL